MDHPIFRTPNRVELTMTDQPTPPSYAHYPEGAELGETMTMWRVQTEGYKDGNGQLIGMVSRDAGFLDSPDAEWISSGANSKGPKAVAIGRHGNFFHWGFAASPTYMTDEAKLVLVNSLHYIARFDGQAPIARKQEGVVTRDLFDPIVASITDEGYVATQATYEGYRAAAEAAKKEIQARIDAGEDVSDRERRSLTRRPIQTPGRFDSVRRIFAGLDWGDLGDDADKVTAYLQEVRPYLRPSGRYELGVDPIAQRLGIANSDPRIIDAAIAMLADEPRRADGALLLATYTDASFTTPAEWQAWRQANRDRMFFTEAAGYKWLVNTLDRGEAAPAAPALSPTKRRPLDWSAHIERAADGATEVVVDVSILGGWHAYDEVPSSSPYAALQLDLVLPAGVSAIGDWVKPESDADIHDHLLTVWHGEVQFRRVIEGLGDGDELICSIRHQVCDERMCMPPTSETRVVEPDRAP